MLDRVRSEAVIHTEATPVPVLDSALPKTLTGRFSVYCGDRPNLYTSYHDTTVRKRDGPTSFLQDCGGDLQVDAFAVGDRSYAGANVHQAVGANAGEGL